MTSRPSWTLTPHAWGCTGAHPQGVVDRYAYPTRVGMHRYAPIEDAFAKRLPHTRGDAPELGLFGIGCMTLTPHAWGCTGQQRPHALRQPAYPTRVGMHRPAASARAPTAGLPHTRGDAPSRPATSAPRSMLTPHAWGCTAAAPERIVDRDAYPTRVGMHPARRRRGGRWIRLPHTRGDAPPKVWSAPGAAELTPHAWGCTIAAGPARGVEDAYPTRVGMHRPSRTSSSS